MPTVSAPVTGAAAAAARTPTAPGAASGTRTALVCGTGGYAAAPLPNMIRSVRCGVAAPATPVAASWPATTITADQG